MANTYKILGQITGSASTQTLYTVPAATSAVVSTITVCNFDDASTVYSIAAVPSGDSLGDKHYVAFNTAIAGKDTAAITIGVTLATGDSIVVINNESGSFSAFGTEIS